MPVLFDHDVEVGKNAYELYLQYARMMVKIREISGADNV